MIMKIDNDIILKYQRCEATEAEEKQLLDFLDESEANRESMDRANFLYCAGVLGQRRHMRKNRRILWISAVAGVAAAAVIGLVFLFSHEKNTNTPGAEYVVEGLDNARTRVCLPDGSIVRLNAGSKLSYQEKFNREVSLTGEACFEVAANENHPFRVSIGELTLVVTGTVFNVRAYKDEPRIETTLASGKLRIENSLGEQIFLLRPGQKVSCDVNGGDIVSTSVDAWELLLDIYGQVTISDVSLTELCGILEHIYNVSIKVRSDDGTAVTFSFAKDTPIETILSRLETVSQRTLELQ